jgi:hypothetical protein
MPLVEEKQDERIGRLARCWKTYCRYLNSNDFDPNIGSVEYDLGIAICDVIGAPRLGEPHGVIRFPTREEVDAEAAGSSPLDQAVVDRLREAWGPYAIAYMGPLRPFSDSDACLDAAWDELVSIVEGMCADRNAKAP